MFQNSIESLTFCKLSTIKSRPISLLIDSNYCRLLVLFIVSDNMLFDWQMAQVIFTFIPNFSIQMPLHINGPLVVCTAHAFNYLSLCWKEFINSLVYKYKRVVDKWIVLVVPLECMIKIEVWLCIIWSIKFAKQRLSVAVFYSVWLISDIYI